MDSSTLLGIGFLVAGGLVTLSEIHTLTVYLLVLAVGLFGAGAAALMGASLTVDLVVLAIILALGLPAAHWWRRKLKNREADEVSQDDTGNHVIVLDADRNPLRVSYRGSTWDARFDFIPAQSPLAGDAFVIRRREGNVLIIAPRPSHS